MKYKLKLKNITMKLQIADNSTEELPKSWKLGKSPIFPPWDKGRILMMTTQNTNPTLPNLLKSANSHTLYWKKFFSCVCSLDLLMLFWSKHISIQMNTGKPLKLHIESHLGLCFFPNSRCFFLLFFDYWLFGIFYFLQIWTFDLGMEKGYKELSSSSNICCFV